MEELLKLGVKSLERVFKDCTFKIRTGLAKGLYRRYGFGFKPKFKLTEEEKFLLGFNLIGKTVYDIGGYIGIYTIFFARAVGEGGEVITFEPNPRNFYELKKNVELNHFANVKLFPIGLGKSKTQAPLLLDRIYPSRGRIVKNHARERNLGSKLITIEIESLDNLMAIHKLSKPDFIKIDVEGYEMEVLYGMTKIIDQFKPSLIIEVHGDLTVMMEWLQLKGYSIRHVETGLEFEEIPLTIDSGTHIYCRGDD